MTFLELYLSQNDGTSLGSKQFLFLHHVYDFPNIPFHVVLKHERVVQMSQPVGCTTRYVQVWSNILP